MPTRHYKKRISVCARGDADTSGGASEPPPFQSKSLPHLLNSSSSSSTKSNTSCPQYNTADERPWPCDPNAVQSKIFDQNKDIKTIEATIRNDSPGVTVITENILPAANQNCPQNDMQYPSTSSTDSAFHPVLQAIERNNVLRPGYLYPNINIQSQDEVDIGTDASLTSDASVMGDISSTNKSKYTYRYRRTKNTTTTTANNEELEGSFNVPYMQNGTADHAAQSLPSAEGPPVIPGTATFTTIIHHRPVTRETPSNNERQRMIPQFRKSHRQQQLLRNYDSDSIGTWASSAPPNNNGECDQRRNDGHSEEGGSVDDTSTATVVGAVAVYGTGRQTSRPSALTSIPSTWSSVCTGSYHPERAPPSSRNEPYQNTRSRLPPLREPTIIENGINNNNPLQDMEANESQENLDKAPPKSWYKSRAAFWIMLGIIILALSIGLAIGIVTGLQLNDDNISSSQPLVTEAPTVTPTVDPMKIRLFQENIIERGITNNDTIANTASPQYAAYRWLLEDDELSKFSESMNEQQIETMKTRYILAVIYFALDGDNWISKEGWLEKNTSHCQWEFLDCDNSQTLDYIHEVKNRQNLEKVTGIRTVSTNNTFHPDEGKQNMAGALPSELNHLSELDFLLLPGNKITDVSVLQKGPKSLRAIDLSYNPLIKHESLFVLTDLEFLAMVDTEWDAELSTDIRQLSNLRILDLSYNNLQGTITNQFSNMYQLQTLSINRNKLHGQLGDILGCCKCSYNCSNTLTKFTSWNNPISGTLPSDVMTSCTSLKDLEIVQSNIHGMIPSELSELSDMINLDLSLNQELGSIPDDDIFVDVFLSSNSNRSLPKELSSLTRLELFSISGSVNIIGLVPSEYSNMTSLKRLLVDRTGLNGTIPNSICNLPNLELIRHSKTFDCICPNNPNLCELV